MENVLEGESQILLYLLIVLTVLMWKQPFTSNLFYKGLQNTP